MNTKFKTVLDRSGYHITLRSPADTDSGPDIDGQGTPAPLAQETRSRANFEFVDDTYPNGTRFQRVSLNGVDLGHLVKSESGYAAPGWRKPVASKYAALEKMRAAGVAERKRQIATLQVEINKLAAA